MIQLSPVDGTVRINSDGKVLLRHFWRYKLLPNDCYPYKIPFSLFFPCANHPDDAPFSQLSLLSDGCVVPPEWIAVSGTCVGYDTICRKIFQRQDCSTTPLGTVVPYPQTWRNACDCEHLVIEASTQEAAEAQTNYASYITATSGRLLFYDYWTAGGAEVPECNAPSAPYGIYAEYPGSVPKRVPGQGLSNVTKQCLDRDGNPADCPTYFGAAYEIYIHHAETPYSSICFDATWENMTIFLHYELEVPSLGIYLQPCTMQGTVSGFDFDVEKCLPYGNVVVPFYMGSTYRGSLTLNIEIQACP